MLISVLTGICHVFLWPISPPSSPPPRPPIPFQIPQGSFPWPFSSCHSPLYNELGLGQGTWNFHLQTGNPIRQKYTDGKSDCHKSERPRLKWPLPERQIDSTHAGLVMAKSQPRLEFYDTEMTSRNGLCMMEMYSSSLALQDVSFHFLLVVVAGVITKKEEGMQCK